MTGITPFAPLTIDLLLTKAGQAHVRDLSFERSVSSLNDLDVERLVDQAWGLARSAQQFYQGTGTTHRAIAKAKSVYVAFGVSFIIASGLHRRWFNSTMKSSRPPGLAAVWASPLRLYLFFIGGFFVSCIIVAFTMSSGDDTVVSSVPTFRKERGFLALSWVVLGYTTVSDVHRLCDVCLSELRWTAGRALMQTVVCFLTVFLPGLIVYRGKSDPMAVYLPYFHRQRGMYFAVTLKTAHKLYTTAAWRENQDFPQQKLEELRTALSVVREDEDPGVQALYREWVKYTFPDLSQNHL